MKYFNNKLGIAILTTVFITGFNSIAQNENNLLNNPGFESIDGKVKKLGSIENAVEWFSPTGSRADLFTSNKNPEIDVPLNIYGKEEAKIGENYAGIVAFSYGNKVPRSYISTKLSSPMKKGMKYCVEFHVSLAEASKYASNEIGAHISKKPFGFDDKKSIVDASHIKHENNKIFNATYGWEKICGIYEAQGGEKFITIGNFTRDEDVKKENLKASKDVKVNTIVAAYYYIDDVSVRLIDDVKQCACGVENRSEYSATIYQKAVRYSDKASSKEIIESYSTFYAFGKSYLNPTGQSALETIAEKMKADPSIKLEIIGHSNAQEDEVGKEKTIYANMSQKRAETVKVALEELGIEGSRMRVVVKNSEEPSPEILDSDDEDLKQAKSRRVTFKVK